MRETLTAAETVELAHFDEHWRVILVGPFVLDNGARQPANLINNAANIFGGVKLSVKIQARRVEPAGGEFGHRAAS